MNVVLVAPEIPPNCGNVARLCVSVGARLHLVEPLGFELSDRYLKRAGLDYWEHLELTVHPDFASVEKARGDAPMYLATAHAERPYTEVRFGADDWLVFGSETGGLPEEVLERHGKTAIRIPMWGPSRCLNLSNSVAVIVFEALRQTRGGEFYRADAPAAAPAAVEPTTAEPTT